MLMLVNGDYVPQENGLQSAKGDEAVLQRMLMKLTARRGQFPFMENFGSRLWTLDRLRPAERQAAAEQYVLEALRDEPGLMVEQVTLAENGGKASLTVNAVKDECRLTAEVALGQEGVTMGERRRQSIGKC